MREGGCLCGAVRCCVEGEPDAAGICHCATCRRAASAPTLPHAVFPDGRFSFSKGQPVEFHSSAQVTRTFCGCCGSPLTYRTSEAPGRIDIMICSLDDPSSIVPTHHVWLSDRVCWDQVADGLPGFPASRTAGPGFSA